MELHHTNDNKNLENIKQYIKYQLLFGYLNI